MEKLIVKNFGPIKHLEIEVKQFNVFIGTTASGKSTAAKLVAIFKDPGFLQDPTMLIFEQQLKHHNIDFLQKNSVTINLKFF